MMRSRTSPPRFMQILATVALLVLAATVATVTAVEERDRASHVRADGAAHMAGELAKHFRGSAVNLDHVRSEMEVGGGSSAFSRHAQVAARAGGLIVAWAPRVDADRRARFERAHGLRIRDPAAASPSEARPVYFPVTDLAGPAARPASILGVDVAGEPTRWAALQAARDTGELRISSPVSLAGGNGLGVLMMVPAYRGGARPATAAGRRAVFRGVVVGADPLSALASTLRRELPPDARVQVFEGSSRLIGPSGRLEDAGEASVSFGGRTWLVRIAIAGGEASYAFSLMLLVAGLALAGLVAALYRQSARRESASRAVAAELAGRVERHRAVVETAPDAIITIDEGRRIESVNPATERLFGYTAEELVGENVSILMGEPDRSRHDSYVARYLDTGEERVIGRGREVEGRRQDGSTFPAHLSVSEMRVAGRRMFTGIISDLSEQRRAEEALRATALEQAVAAEQGALSRVATAVATGGTPQALFARVAEEVARLLGVEAGIVARFEPDEVAGTVGWWGARLSEAGVSFPLDGCGALAGVRRTGLPARVSDYASLGTEPIARIAQARGYTSSVAAPVHVAGHLWGAVLAATTREDPIPVAAEGRLARFAELVGVAIANAEDRARLVEMATTDPLTGLANHGAFFERLNVETERARRYGRPLGLVVLDIDHFKRVNDAHGHPAGDRVLIEVARRLQGLARSGDMLARVGGEEFAWLQPESDGPAAQLAAERACQEVRGAPFAQVGRLSISAGVCALTRAAGAAELVDLADRALYQAKERGRDLVVRYEPDDELVAMRRKDSVSSEEAGAEVR